MKPDSATAFGCDEILVLSRKGATSDAAMNSRSLTELESILALIDAPVEISVEDQCEKWQSRQP
jgi:hypothetical protein